MAKSLTNKGHLETHTMDKVDAKQIISRLYEFVEKYRKCPERLSSCVFIFPGEDKKCFEQGEKLLWRVLKEMRSIDQSLYAHDPRVSSNPKSGSYSYSVKEEAMFVLLLHPQSPRLARRFKHTTIVFNPHQQFETLRKKNIFFKIRDQIRKMDFALQGSENKMLNDFGTTSEVFQYSGRRYGENAVIEL